MNVEIEELLLSSESQNPADFTCNLHSPLIFSSDKEWYLALDNILLSSAIPKGIVYVSCDLIAPSSTLIHPFIHYFPTSELVSKADTGWIYHSPYRLASHRIIVSEALSIRITLSPGLRHQLEPFTLPESASETVVSLSFFSIKRRG